MINTIKNKQILYTLNIGNDTTNNLVYLVNALHMFSFVDKSNYLSTYDDFNLMCTLINLSCECTLFVVIFQKKKIKKKGIELKKELHFLL